MAATPKGLDGGGQLARRSSEDLSSMTSPKKLVAGGLSDGSSMADACHDVGPADTTFMAAVQQDASSCYVIPQSSMAANSRPVVPMLSKAPHPSITLPVPVSDPCGQAG